MQSQTMGALGKRNFLVKRIKTKCWKKFLQLCQFFVLSSTLEGGTLRLRIYTIHLSDGRLGKIETKSLLAKNMLVRAFLMGCLKFKLNFNFGNYFFHFA